LVPYIKTFSSGAFEAQVICSLKKTEPNISESLCKNASNFLLNGQISVPEWCVDFSETPYSSYNSTDVILYLYSSTRTTRKRKCFENKDIYSYLQVLDENL